MLRAAQPYQGGNRRCPDRYQGCVAAFLLMLVFGTVLAESASDTHAAGSASNASKADESAPLSIPADVLAPTDSLQQKPATDPCTQLDSDYESWLDSGQVIMYRSVCGAAAWFDGFFGDLRFDRETGNTYGRIGGGAYWDERDGWDEKFRFRARFALPGLRERGAILIGRGDEEQLLEEKSTSRADQLPSASNLASSEDDALFMAFGFRSINTAKRGLDFSAGVKFNAPPEPFVKASYRHIWQISQNNLLHVRPIIYWRDEEGFGSTLTAEIDHIINSAMLLRWRNFGNVSEDEEVEGVDWGSSVILFQALSNRKALTYSVFVRGETKAEITTKNFGLEFRYRQRFLRDWLFIEYIGGVSWPRELLTEKREMNFGGGLLLEAYFGPAPDDWVR